jgi:hypothetical protein
MAAAGQVLMIANSATLDRDLAAPVIAPGKMARTDGQPQTISA